MSDQPTLSPRRVPGGAPYQVADTDQRLPALAAEVAQRLRPLCGTMPEAEFEALVRAVALRKLRWG
jgi:hypothetical protein